MVRYIEEREGAEGWLIIENAPDPNPLLHEFPPDHPASRELLGKKVGDDFLLAQGRVQPRPARVVEIRDSIALKTLLMLGLEDILRYWPRRVLVPQAVICEIAAWIEVARMGERDHYVMGGAEVGYAPTPVATEVHRSRRARYERLLDLIRDSCEVCDGRLLAAVAPDLRDQLIEILGRDGAEAMLLSAQPGHVLWTDDQSAAVLATQTYSARRVWTQIALNWRHANGAVDDIAYEDASAMLLGWGYVSTRFGVATLARAGCLAGWNVDGWPLAPCLDLLAGERINLREVLPIAAGLLVQVHRHVASPVARDIVTIRIAERLATR